MTQVPEGEGIEKPGKNVQHQFSLQRLSVYSLRQQTQYEHTVK